MDQRERWEDFEEAIRTAVEAHQARTWTNMPGQVVSFDPETQTAKVQITVKSVQRMPDGSTKRVSLPVLEDVPVHFPSGGGATLTFPVSKGDECWISFASRPIDTWHQNGGEQDPNDSRMHDLSDARVEVGTRSQPKRIKNFSKDSTQFRSDDGEHVVDLHPKNGLSMNSSKAISMSVSEGGKTSSFKMTGAGIEMASEKLAHNQHNISGDHKHTGVEPGGGESGPPEAA